MKYQLMFCNECKEYTLNDKCHGKKTRIASPPKFSPDDKYSEYRLRIKKEEWGIKNRQSIQN